MKQSYYFSVGGETSINSFCLLSFMSWWPSFLSSLRSRFSILASSGLSLFSKVERYVFAVLWFGKTLAASAASLMSGCFFSLSLKVTRKDNKTLPPMQTIVLNYF